ncbi:hypothetical protein Tco_1360792 [Tanacetum coccineum]
MKNLRHIIQDKEDADKETDVNDDSDETESDNDGDDLTHPNLSTYKADDEEEEQEKADDKEMSSDQRVATAKFFCFIRLGVKELLTPSHGHRSTTTTTIPITTLPDIPNFASLFWFKQRVSVLETENLSLNKPISNISRRDSVPLLHYGDIMFDKISYFQEEREQSRSDVQKDLYKALVESYNSDKDIISSYGDVVILERSRDDQDKDEDPSAGSNRGSKRRRSGKEAESSKEPTHKESKSTSSLKDWHNPEGGPYPHDLSKPLPLILNEQGRQVIPLDHFINNDLEYLKGGRSSQKYTTSITKTKAVNMRHVNVIEDKFLNMKSSKSCLRQVCLLGNLSPGSKMSKFYEYATNMESSKDVYSRHRIIEVTSLKIMQFFGYNHLEEIIVRRQDDQLYKFRERDFKRLRRQDIEDMLLLLVKGKLTNLSLEERYALNVALQMFTRQIVIQERMEDLQLGIKSYQKKINLTKPNT